MAMKVPSTGLYSRWRGTHPRPSRSRMAPALPGRIGQMLDIAVVRVRVAVPVQLKMHTETVRVRLVNRIEGLVYGIRISVESKRKKHSLAIVYFGVDGQMIPRSCGRTLARNACRRPAAAGGVPNTEDTFVVRALHGELVPTAAHMLVG